MIQVLDHPLLAHKVTVLRDETTDVAHFRKTVREIAGLMCYAAMADLPTRPVEVRTPLAVAQCRRLATEPVVIPILRAGLGMVDGVLDLMPEALVGHIGMARDHETHEPVQYYCNLPADIDQRPVFVVDPMLATGGSAAAAIEILKREHGCRNITMLNILAAPEGAAVIAAQHPDVAVYIAAMDQRLNENAYILPGLGDAGDRIFGTM